MINFNKIVFTFLCLAYAGNTYLYATGHNPKSYLAPEFIETIKQYVLDHDNLDIPITKFLSPDELREKIDFSISSDGESLEKLREFISCYLNYGTRVGSKRFCNQTFAGVSVPAFWGEVITALTNAPMYTYECAPVATLIEKELIQKLCSLVGFTQGEGIFVTGGSNANLIALFAARQKALPEAKNTGVYESPQKLVAFVSDQAHYSFVRSLNLLGLGMNNLIKIKSDAQGKMLVPELEKEILCALDKGLKPFFVAAAAGTTVLGAFDSIQDVARIAKKYDLWCHVDAAFGGCCLFSKKQRYRLQGIEQADSVTWDFHKVISIPLMCSTILFNKPGILKSINHVKKEDYHLSLHNCKNRYDYDAEPCYNLRAMSMQCGRRVDALKLWLDWKYYGENGYTRRIDHLVDLAKYAEQKILSHVNLVLACPVQFLPVCFYYLPDFLKTGNNPVEINSFNFTLRERLLTAGKWMANQTIVNNKLVLRPMFVYSDMTKKDVDDFFKEIEHIAKELEH